MRPKSAAAGIENFPALNIRHESGEDCGHRNTLDDDHVEAENFRHSYLFFRLGNISSGVFSAIS